MTNNLSIKTYVNERKNRITFNFKTGYYLALLTSGIMTFPGISKSKVNKDKNGENVSHSKSTNDKKQY